MRSILVTYWSFRGLAREQEILSIDTTALHSHICCVNPASNFIPRVDTSRTVDGRIFWSLQNIGRQFAMASVSSERTTTCQRKSFRQLRLDENDGYEGNWNMNDLGMLNQNRVWPCSAFQQPGSLS